MMWVLSTAAAHNFRIFLIFLLVLCECQAFVFVVSSGYNGQRQQLAATATTAVQPPADLYLYNSQTRSKQKFVLIPDDDREDDSKEEEEEQQQQRPVRMYTCGPTVYDCAHVGNFRAFLTYDLLKRVLLFLGYDVTHVLNLTDVDDKIVAAANKQKLTHVKELTLRYERQFRNDLAALHVLPPTVTPRATECVGDMMDLIRDLYAKGLAYETQDGSWYYRTQEREGYGQQLVQLNWDEMMPSGEDGGGACTKKEHFADFCLWKAFKEGVDRDDAAWSSHDHWAGNEVGITILKGRPGWHLECSAMVRKYFGDATLDFHGGGVDLQFPHHENEIAQSEAVTGNKFCNCWFHNGFVNMGSEKMSKSLGNFVTLRQACPTSISVRAYRFLVTSSQYRNPLSFTSEVLTAAERSVKRLDKVWARLQAYSAKEDAPSGTHDESPSELAEKTVPAAQENFLTAITDDLSMPRAAAVLFGLVKAAEAELRKEYPDKRGLAAVRQAMAEMDKVWGIFYTVPGDDETNDKINESEMVPEEVLELVTKRSQAKESKDWELADSLRSRISELGFTVKDVKGGEPIVNRIE